MTKQQKSKSNAAFKKWYEKNAKKYNASRAAASRWSNKRYRESDLETDLLPEFLLVEKKLLMGLAKREHPFHFDR